MGSTSIRAMALAIGIAGVAGGAVAGTVNGFTSAWFFGDSLSDPGNLFAATGGAQPSDPPYFEGRFSNGQVWAEYIADDFTEAGMPNGNFAFGGAGAVRNGDGIPDLADQVGAFALTSGAATGARPVAAIWVGANDVFGGVATGQAELAGTAAARSVAENALVLAGLGFRDVALLNLPDLSMTPLYNLYERPLAGAARAGSLAFNDTLSGLVPSLKKAGLNVIEIDIETIFADMIENPADFGVRDAVVPCVSPFGTVCTAEEALERAFYDPVHPNSVIHEELAMIVSSDIAPVPLPASVLLLLGGLAGMVLVAQRRAS